MVGRHHGNAFQLSKFSPISSDRNRGNPHQSLNGRRTQRHQNPRLNDSNLLHQKRSASDHLLRRGFPVPIATTRRVGPALEDIAYIDLLAGKAHRLNDPGEELPRLPYKRFALGIFILVSGLAFEN